MAGHPPPTGQGMMSLYADLLGGPAEEEKKPEAKPKDAIAKNPALRFQPIIRRPQQNKAKAKPKNLPPASGSSAASNIATATASATATSASSTAAAAAAAAAPSSASAPTSTARTTTTLADWTAAGDDDDDYYYEDDQQQQRRPQRGGRKKKKKRLEEKMHQQRMYGGGGDMDWDEIYDPARPTNMDVYLHSDERIAAVREWKAVLYSHRRQREKERQQQEEQQEEEQEEEEEEKNTDESDVDRPQFNRAFAPPTAFLQGAVPPPPPPLQKSTSPTPKTDPLPPPPPPPPGLVVSKAPVRFQPAQQPEPEDQDMQDVDNDDDDVHTSQPPPAERTSRPGQAGFAARLMAKYGWTQGSGLGADESGIVNPLRHKKLKTSGPNAPQGRIVGGKRPKGSKDTPATTGTTTGTSRVVVLRNMVNDMPDLAAEVADGQLVQEIGEECGSQYGRVERVHVDVAAHLVFLQFTDAVSALRAVTALDGRIFNGNAIVPSFYDEDKFDQGIYE